MINFGVLYLYLAIVCIGLVNGHVKIVQTNDDGWAVANIRAQNDALVAAGFNVVLSAPAKDKSGTGSDDATPTRLGSSGCEFGSCPPKAPATGFNASNPRLNYVNSFPATSVRFGIQTVSPQFFDGSGPDFVVSGPNVGNNLGITDKSQSGTVGAACEAAKEGIPSVAFSGKGGSHVSYTTLSTSSSSTTTALTFAALGTKFVQALLSTPFNTSSPILPPNITLNVNYPAASGSCTNANAFQFVLSRVTAAASDAAPDVETCGSDRLPIEKSVVDMSGGCFASVSVINATTKSDVDAATQAFVLKKLSGFLTCLP